MYRLSISLIALIAATPVLAQQQSARDFTLPPAPTPTATGPAVQGPVDPEAPIATRPRPTPTAAPTSVPILAPSPSTSPSPRATPTTQAAPNPRQTPAQRPTAAAPRPVVQQPGIATANTQPTTATAPDAGTNTDANAAEEQPETSVASAPVVASETPAAPDAATQKGNDAAFPWWLALIAAVVALAAGLLVWRKIGTRADDVPEIEPPRTVPHEPPASETPAPAAAAVAKGLVMKARAVKLNRSMMNATLSYELTVTNHSARTLAKLDLGGELVSAANGIAMGDQLAKPGQSLPPRHTVDQLGPGHSKTFTGNLTLPLQQVSPIRQGNAALYVPLMRWRAVADDGMQPLAQTYVVGQRSPQSDKLQPFPLDRQLRSFDAIGERALD